MMKNLYGLQLGNFLRKRDTGDVIKINSMTRKKVGYLGKDNQESYVYLRDVEAILIKEGDLKEDLVDNFVPGEEGYYWITPKDSTNVYKLKYYHELQNILAFHGYTGNRQED